MPDMARLYHLDAFTSEKLRGAQAPVIVTDQPVEQKLAMSIAAEFNQPVTAILHPKGDGCTVRFFDSKTEYGLVGHAGLAAGFIALTKLFPARNAIVLESPIGGALPVSREGESIVLDFGAARGTEVPSIPNLDETFPGVAVRERLSAAFGSVAVLADEDSVRNLSPDFARALDVPGDMVIATAPGRNADFVSRVFAPKFDLPEDPVCGSAHRILTPYWAARLGRDRLTAHQVSARGGHFTCESRGDRVRLGGQAVLLFEADFAMPD
jgi:predicted PhzF superfamily epimerase YddE/YHI9